MLLICEGKHLSQETEASHHVMK